MEIDPEINDDILACQRIKESKICVSCDSAISNNSSCITEGNLTFIFVATCTLDYFLSFMRLAFLNNHHLHDFLKSSTQQQIVMAQAFLKMEPSLRALDWNMARFIWAEMIGNIDKALNDQFRSEAVFSVLKVFSCMITFFITR